MYLCLIPTCLCLIQHVVKCLLRLCFYLEFLTVIQDKTSPVINNEISML